MFIIVTLLTTESKSKLYEKNVSSALKNLIYLEILNTF